MALATFHAVAGEGPPWVTQAGDKRPSAVPSCPCQPGWEPRSGWAVTTLHGGLTAQQRLSFIAVLWAVLCTAARDRERSRRPRVFLLPVLILTRESLGEAGGAWWAEGSRDSLLSGSCFL